MQFRTHLPSLPSAFQLHHATPVMTMGSCFAQMIGHRLVAARIPTLVNPFGVSYHPLALFTQLRQVWENDTKSPIQFAPHLHLYHSFDYATQFNTTERLAVEQAIEAAKSQARKHLSRCRHLILTFGTAWAYRRKDTGALVANNHKYPSEFFQKELLSLQQITEGFYELMRLLQHHVPEMQILLTVSPVRHLRDTLVLNSVSKASLRLACHQFREQFSNVHYFPAYELMMDDLRDYRFYREDLLHPTAQAEAYIWEHFVQSCMPADTRSLVERWTDLQKSLTHRPLHPATPQYQQFLQKLLAQLEALPSQIDCQAEIVEVQAKLASLR